MTQEVITNKKSGKQAIVLCRYNRFSDNVEMIEVFVINGGRRAFWMAQNCE